MSSVVSLLSAIFPILHFIPAPLPQVKPCPPFLPPPLPVEDEGRSSFGLRLQGQHPLALSTLLLVGGPVPLLALRAAVACHLAAAADVELSELQKDEEQEHVVRISVMKAWVMSAFHLPIQIHFFL